MILDNFVECKKKFENVVDMKKKIIWKLNLYDIVNFTDLKITE
jgi:hypothetical protein